MLYKKRFSIQANREYGVTIHIRIGQTVYLFGYAVQSGEFYKGRIKLDEVIG